MRKHAETLILHSIGWVFVIAGVVAGFVPFVPGFVLIIVGIYIISLRSVWLKRKLDFFRKYYPGFDHTIVRFEEWAVRTWKTFAKNIKKPFKFFFKN